MKMTKKFDELNDTFNVKGEIVSKENEENTIEKIEKVNASFDDIKKDYNYTRGNL